MIRLDAVTKTFNEGAGNAFQALRGIDLEIDTGRATVLRGPSGSGKTTLLSLIGALARPTSGRIHLDGREIGGLPERFLTEVRRATLGFVFQSFNLIPGLTVLDNVMLPAYPLGVTRAVLRRRAGDRLAELRLTDKAAVRAGTLSGGEAQRVAIARALINDPPVLIADEPTANLDSALSREFLAVAADLKAGGRTLVLSSHDPLVWGDPLVDRVVSLRDGRIVPEDAG